MTQTNSNNTHSIRLIKELQYPSGLFAAAAKHVTTGYNRAWIKDNIYEAMAFEHIGDWKTALKTYHRILDILRRNEYKIDWMIVQPYPKEAYRYIHARYDPETGNEILEPWGNKQHQMVGLLLFKIGELARKGIPVLRDEHDKIIVQKIVHYLEAVEYWQDMDNGEWEEAEELHASSIGACAAGLQSVKGIVHVPDELIKKGKEALNQLLPKESETKEVDMAQLALIWPLKIVTPKQRDAILKNVEQYLVRDKGVIRYIGDKYYGNGKAAEWPLGFAWLAAIYKHLGIEHKHKFFLHKTETAMNEKGELPELYYGMTSTHNENTPLGWTQALYVIAS